MKNTLRKTQKIRKIISIYLILLTRIPFGPQSIAKHRVNISKPAFETQYGNESGNCVREKVFIPYFSCVLCPNTVDPFYSERVGAAKSVH